MTSRLTQTRITDTDLYFLTTGNVVQQKFPGVEGRFHLFSRKRKPMHIDEKFLKVLQTEINALENDTFSSDVADYITNQHPILTAYVDTLKDQYHIASETITIGMHQDLPDIYWQGPLEFILNYESTIMSLLTELYSTVHHIHPDENWEKRVVSFAQAMKQNGIPFTEGGTRRRLSRNFQKEVLTILKAEAGPYLKATSNAGLAYELSLPCYGTFPHAYVQLMAAIYGYKAANLQALIQWSDIYHGQFASFLPDTFTTPVGLATHEEFERHFPKKAGIFRTFRNDSLPYDVFIDRYMLPYAKRRGIPPKDITVIHSDGMNLESTLKAAEYTRKADFNVAFIIGTYLTHTISGHEGFDLVAKLEYVRVSPTDPWIPVCKLSDVVEKRSGPGDSVQQAIKELVIS